METVRSCGCKGIRTCLICEKEYSISKLNVASELQKQETYVYCPYCNKAWPGWNYNEFKVHPNHSGNPIDYPGVYIQMDFLSIEEANSLLKDLDSLPWDISQSGRRKQNFGPKCNFKKRRLRLGEFTGFPKTTHFVQDKFSNVELLNDFQTIEQCSLEYNPERGASIDPHIDDCWIWGERIVTVNIVVDSVLTMTPYLENSRYNLDCVSSQKLIGNEKNVTKPSCENIVVRIPMPERSLIVLYGEARYAWEHAVLREDINSRRVCIAYREFTTPYLPNGDHNSESVEIFQQATNFW